MKADAIKAAQYEIDFLGRSKTVTDVTPTDHPLEMVLSFSDGTTSRVTGLIASILKEELAKPALLYYNCDSPVKILETRVIKSSKIFGGVSFSEWRELGSHGPFKITFAEAPWFSQLTKVKYGDGSKNPMFEDEQEWFGTGELHFQLSEVREVMYMENAPCALGPRVLKRTLQELREKWPELYLSGMVNDPYLR